MPLFMNEKNQHSQYKMDINLKNNPLALVGIKSTDPEIIGTDSMELNIEIPVGETPVKVHLSANSTVASSILAQEKLNQIARDNINFLGSKIADGIQYIMDNAYYFANRIHEIEKLQNQWRKEEMVAE